MPKGLHSTMSRQKIIITLSLKDQKFLEQLLSKGTSPARTIRRAQILLNSNRKGKKQYTTEELADLLSTKKQTVSRVLKEYEVSGIECIYRKKRKTPPVESKITGEVEAHVIAMACHNPPEGYCRWTLRLLSERMVQMNYIDKISHTASRSTKTRQKIRIPLYTQAWKLARHSRD